VVPIMVAQYIVQKFRKNSQIYNILICNGKKCIDIDGKE
jgi:hypothetical protein